MSNFGHLHRHSEFSRLDGIGTAKQYAARAVELDQGFLAQTDHGTLAGALHHIHACRKVGIVPIVGVEAYYRPNRLLRVTRQAWHLVLLAKNLRGWHNLLRITSTAYAEQSDGGGFYQYPCVDDELLKRYSEGIICSTACNMSWLAHLIKAGDEAAASEYVSRMKNLYRDDFYLEIQPHDFDEQRVLNTAIVQLAQFHSVALLATNDTHFVYPDWAETQRVTKMMATKLSFSKVEQMIEKGEEPPYMAELHQNLYLSSDKEMYSWFTKYHPDISGLAISEALHNTQLLAASTKPFILDRTDKLPKVTDTPEEAEAFLWAWVNDGLNKIRDQYPPEHWSKWPIDVYDKRVASEMEILKDKGAIPYMVMVADIIRWGKSQGIRFGPGRGSAAGCLVSYLVGITAIDPIPWGLLFERFLNPGRKGMPDIDIDVASGDRAKIKQYIIEKYGADHVADIITHERFQPKSVLQRLCRVFDVPYVEAHAVTDTIDIRQDDEETTLEELLPLNEKLQEFRSKYPHIWEHALRLEGTVANFGKHAAGVVITPKPIIEYMSLDRGKKGDLVTSWSDSADFMVISDNGFQKIDLLALKSLERHDLACNLILQRHGQHIDLNSFHRIHALRDPDDPVVYREPSGALDMFTEGFTIALFQFSSKGITNLLKQIKPTSVRDLCAANALYRPGAMKSGATWEYAKFKHHEKEPEYPDAISKPVLEETYGLVAYQEQIMVLAQVMAGFTPGQADDLRKAMGKLYRIKGGKAAREYMRQHEQLWFDGCRQHGIHAEIARQVWQFVLDRSSYNFNKSHSACYALIAYQDAYLKKFYPLEFYAAILSLPSGSSPQEKQDFMSSVVREAKMRGIQFLSPDINRSKMDWSIDGEEDGEGRLRFGLTGIKDVGDVAAAKIIEHRSTDYESIDDVRNRCGSKVNKKVIEALTEAGAFDCFGARDEASASQIATWEKDRLKVVINGVSDIDKYAHLIRPNIFTQEEVERLPKGQKGIIIGGEITRFEKKTTKDGRPFANATVSFDMNEWRVRFWEKELIMFEDLLGVGSAIMVNGRKDEWNGFISVICHEAIDLNTMAEDAALIAEGIM